ncbi:MAG: hypothetical protein VKK04_25930 [Synechococcales bacterium]|nr:hypothetical protein [Synechococcales bacterium]
MKYLINHLQSIIRRAVISMAIACLLVIPFLHLATQPVAAAPMNGQAVSPSQTEQIEREQAYEAAAGIAKDPDGMEEEYEKNLDAYYDRHPEENPNILQEAEELVETVIDDTTRSR